MGGERGRVNIDYEVHSTYSVHDIEGSSLQLTLPQK